MRGMLAALDIASRWSTAFVDPPSTFEPRHTRVNFVSGAVSLMDSH